MKTVALVFALIFSWAVACGQTTPEGTAPPAGQSMTLQQAVQTALAKNPAVEAADDYARAVEQGIEVAKAGRYPHVDFSEGVTRGNNPVYVFGSLLTQRQFAAANFALGFLNTPPPLDNFRTAFSASMPLYDAGQMGRMIRNARLQAQSAAAKKDRTQQEIIFEVVNAYLNELLARESVRVAESNAATTKSDLARAQARTDTGLAPPSDVLSAKAQLAQAEEDVLRAQNALELARAALNVSMGISEDTPTEIAGDLDERNYPNGSLKERQTKALTTRPEYLEAAIGKQQADNGVHMARAEFLPKLSFMSSWELDNQTFASRGGNNWTVGASLNVNLFDGGAKWARLRVSKAKEMQADALQRQVAATIRLQVREAYLNLETAQKRLGVVKDASSEAAESVRITQNRFEAGLATITDLLQVETAKAAADKNELNARYDYRLSYAALELATGELSPNSAALN
jgi:outer membrane protein